MSGVSGKEAWQLDTRAAKAKDRAEHGLPAEIYVPKTLGGKPVLVHVYDETIDVIVCIPHEDRDSYVGQAQELALASERAELAA